MNVNGYQIDPIELLLGAGTFMYGVIHVAAGVRSFFTDREGIEGRFAMLLVGAVLVTAGARLIDLAIS
jgi:hypothetical protein